MNIVLCGMPKSGKSMIGQALAKKIPYLFIDTDRLIEDAYYQQTGQDKTCREIFILEGRENFRKLESLQLQALQFHTECIISLGGGALELSGNQLIARSLGYIVYLTVPLAILMQRMLQQGLPAYLTQLNFEQELAELAKKRVPVYQSEACLSIDPTSTSEEHILDEILHGFFAWTKKRTSTNGK